MARKEYADMDLEELSDIHRRLLDDIDAQEQTIARALRTKKTTEREAARIHDLIIEKSQAKGWRSNGR